MKKNIVLILVFSLLSFGLVLPVLAEENAPAATSTESQNQVVSPAPTPSPAASPAVYKPRQVVIYGELTAISQLTVPSELIVKIGRVIPPKVAKLANIYPKKDALVKVAVTDKTKIVRKFMGRADISELAVGDKLMVTGKLQEDGSITAQLVKDDSIHKTFYAKKGEVITINSAPSSIQPSGIDTVQTFGLVITNEKGRKEFKIFVTPNTKFAKWGVKAPTFADLKVGDRAAVRGVIRQAANEITADSVVIQVSQEEIAAKKLEEKKAAVLKQAEQKKTNLIKQLEKKKTQLEKKMEKVKGKALENAQKELKDVDKKIQESATSSVQ